MLKFVFLLFLSNKLIASNGFFIDSGDIKKFFGIPSFFEIYKKEGSENYDVDDYRRDPERAEYHSYRDEDHEKGNKEPNLEIIYPKKNKPRKYKYYYEDGYDRENSDRNEQVYKKYKLKNEDHLCDYHSRRNKDFDKVRYIEKPDESRNKENKRLVSKDLKEDLEEERRETLKKLKKKDYVTGILLALPKFTEAADKSNEFYIVKDNMKHYFKTIEKESKSEKEE